MSASKFKDVLSEIELLRLDGEHKEITRDGLLKIFLSLGVFGGVTHEQYIQNLILSEKIKPKTGHKIFIIQNNREK